MTEKEKMLAGQRYLAAAPELTAMLQKTRELMYQFNSKRPSETKELKELTARIFGKSDETTHINQPLHVDYGWNIFVGRNFFANFNLTILDEGTVTIGDNCFLGPNVSIYTACHPLEPEERNKQIEWAEPVTIGNNVWIGGSVTITPGVTIGDNVTIGAGSVVVKDIPSNCVAVGNPARVVRRLDEQEKK